jgi:hypothetical protein
LSIKDLRDGEAHRDFRKKYNAPTEVVLATDFSKLMDMVGGGWTINQPRPNTLELHNRSRSSFAELGYGEDAEDKQRIAKYIVENYIQNPHEVVYLSTGTTVFEVGVALITAVAEGKKDNIRVILTDNEAIREFFVRRASTNTNLRAVNFPILQGTIDYSHADFKLENFDQLAQWEFSTAVVSATRVNPWSGRISSYRQPKTKQSFFSGVTVDKVLIPVLPEKITRSGGGLVVYDPDEHEHADDREYCIITTALPEHVIKSLEAKRYKVRRCSPISEASTLGANI